MKEQPGISGQARPGPIGSRLSACRPRLGGVGALFLILVFIFSLLVTFLYASEIKPKIGATGQNTWVWDGRELKPKIGANSQNTWVWDGRELKPKTGAASQNTWVWDGKEFKPKTGATSQNTWVWNGREFKPKMGATNQNTLVIERGVIKAKSAGNNEAWDIGDTPMPVVAGALLVVLRLF